MKAKTINTEKFPSLYYRVSGQGDAIVLLHGFPLDGSIWNKVSEKLSETNTVIVPDIPGSGESMFNGDELSMEDMADAVRAILKEEGIDKAIVAGHSMGGYAALAFAEKFPGMITGLALVHSSATADNDEKKEQRRKSIALFEKGGQDAFIKQMIPTLFAEQNKDRFKEEIEELTELALLTETKSLIAFYNAMINRPDRTNVLKGATMPVLWAIGEDDNVIPYKNLIQQTSLATVNFVHTHANCGHMGMIEVPADLSNNIKAFAGYCYNQANGINE